MQTPLQGAFRCVWMQNRVFLLMYVWAKVTTGEIEFVYLSTGDIVADCIIKNPSQNKLDKF